MENVCEISVYPWGVRAVPCSILFVLIEKPGIIPISSHNIFISQAYIERSAQINRLGGSQGPAHLAKSCPLFSAVL